MGKCEAKMLIGYVHNFVVLRICYKVDMGHVVQDFVFFRTCEFGQTRFFLKHVTCLVCLEQNSTTKMTAWTMGSFHGFGKIPIKSLWEAVLWEIVGA